MVAYRIGDVEPLRELRLGFDTPGGYWRWSCSCWTTGASLAIHAMRARPHYLDLLP